jgi:TolB-like protein/Flp pilus assembly protein TadD
MPTGAVFLSYASEDAEAAARICASLRAAGIEVWFDQSELRGGDAWDAAIREQIKGCALFIPVISRNAHARTEGYFRLEWKLAVDRSHLMAPDQAFLLPVVVDDTPQADKRIPDRFRELQWSRLPAGETTSAFIERVLRLLSPDGAHVETEARGAPGAPLAASPISSSDTFRRWRSALLVVAAVTVTVVGYFAFDRLVLSKHLAAARPATAVAESVAVSSAVPEKSIAVLPFVDMSEKHDQEYFGDGMAEEILNLLVKIPELKVIGRTSSFQFKGKPDDLRKIGTTLGATYVVEGSVRRSGDHVRVTAQLISTSDGVHRWSDTYDRDVADILRVQNEIAASLVRALQLEVTNLGGPQRRGLPKSGEAYDSYLRGMHALNRFDQRGFEIAVTDFRHALEADPTFVPAAEELSRVLELQSIWGFVRPQAGFEGARAAAVSALKLEPKSALAHAVLGLVHNDYDWDRRAATEELRTAIALAPGDPVVLMDAAEERMTVGQWSDSMRLLEGSIALDPLGPSALENMGFVYVRQGRLADAESAFRHVLEIVPNYVYAHHDLGVVLLIEGKAEAALKEMQEESLSGGQLAGLAVVYNALHRTRDADSALARLEAQSADDQPLEIAEVYAFRGQKDKAFVWLDRAYTQKEVNLTMLMGDPLLKNLESDPRYKAFLRKMNLPD